MIWQNRDLAWIVLSSLSMYNGLSYEKGISIIVVESITISTENKKIEGVYASCIPGVYMIRMNVDDMIENTLLSGVEK